MGSCILNYNRSLKIFYNLKIYLCNIQLTLKITPKNKFNPDYGS